MRQLISLLLAASFSFLLFVGMTLLIEPNKAVANPTTEIPPIVITIDVKDEPPGIRKWPLPKEPDEPETPPKVITTIESDKKHDKVASVDFKIANIKSNTPGIFKLQPLMGGSNSGATNPRVRINPNYPRIAAVEGVEGFVTLSFDISPLGTTENIRVIKASPRGVFEKNARKALRKWKYSPKIVDNKAVAIIGESITLQFKLERDVL